MIGNLIIWYALSFIRSHDVLPSVVWNVPCIIKLSLLNDLSLRLNFCEVLITLEYDFLGKRFQFFIE